MQHLVVKGPYASSIAFLYCDRKRLLFKIKQILSIALENASNF